jgi:hypothetical protein
VFTFFQSLQVAKVVPGVDDYSSFASAIVPYLSEDHGSDAETIANNNEVFYIYGNINRVCLSCLFVLTFLLN